MLKVTNPATGELIRELETDTAESIRAKYDRVRAAQKEWAARPYAERQAMLEKFKSLTQERIDELASIQTAETGKPIRQSKNEISALPGRLDFFLKHSEATLRTETVTLPGTAPEERISYEPLGVIANISAWNYPWFVGTNVFVPALLTGNTVLYKPSEFAACTGLAISDLLHEAGVPADVFIPVIGTGEAGAELLKLPINGVFFTGSNATGKRIAEAASKGLMKVQLELGGKDPTYVCDDVDVKVAAESLADGAFYNTGQSCCSVERIYVHEKIFDPFVDEFVKTVKGFKTGDPRSGDTYIGALTRAPQLDVLDQQVADATRKGAKILTGGKRAGTSGNYFEPTVLTDVNHDMLVMREESFGPIIGIQKVRSDDEAVKLMNDTDYGLTAGVYTRDRARAERVLSQVDAGTAYWNCCDRVSPRLPWTGRHGSGIGSTLSVIGIRAFLQPKAWHLKPAE